MTLVLGPSSNITADTLHRALGRSMRPYYALASDMLSSCLKIARPAAVYKGFPADGPELDELGLNALCSRHFKNRKQIFVFIASCGREAYEWSARSDALERFIADTLLNLLLIDVLRELKREISQNAFGGAHAVFICPGSAPEWPVEAQSRIFHLMGGAPSIGAQLNESCFITPPQSLSGVCLASEKRECDFCALGGSCKSFINHRSPAF